MKRRSIWLALIAVALWMGLYNVSVSYGQTENLGITPTATSTPEPTATSTPEPTATSTPEPSITATSTTIPTHTPAPTHTPVPESTPAPTEVPTQVVSSPGEIEVTPTTTVTPTASPSATPGALPTVEGPSSLPTTGHESGPSLFGTMSGLLVLLFALFLALVVGGADCVARLIVGPGKRE